MRILSYMVVRNEADRYARQSISSVQEHVDGLFIYDDRSDDETVELLNELKVSYLIRPANEPSFIEDESAFRNQAWRRMEKLLRPRQGDWILTLDADEVIRMRHPLRQICTEIADRNCVATWMHVHEMWNETQIRTDGYWAQIRAKRLAIYEPHGEFQTFEDHRLGGGSLPVLKGEVWTTEDAEILHYGYAKERDRGAKYARYKNKTGHASRHIESILQPPILAPLPPLV